MGVGDSVGEGVAVSARSDGAGAAAGAPEIAVHAMVRAARQAKERIGRPMRLSSMQVARSRQNRDAGARTSERCATYPAEAEVRGALRATLYQA
jgi:uncharacterized protein YbjT (DUF2867 family)